MSRIEVSVDRFTPTGRLRASPMYETTVSNHTLGQSKVIRGTVYDEVVRKAKEQLPKWDDQVAKKQSVENCDDLAEAARAYHCRSPRT